MEKLEVVEIKIFQDYIDSLRNTTGEEILNPEFMREFSKFTKKMSDCFGEVVCNPFRHYLFFLNALHYVTDEVYNVAIKCVQNVSFFH